MSLTAASALRKCWQAKAASIVTLDREVGAQVLLLTATSLCSLCFRPRGQRNQRKSKTWDRWENPVAGRTHVVLATLLYPLEPVLPNIVFVPPGPEVRRDSQDAAQIVPVFGYSRGGLCQSCRVRTLSGCH